MTAAAEKKEITVSDSVKKILTSVGALSGDDKSVLMLEMVKSMTGLELVGASKMMEEQLGVTASGGGMMMVSGGGGTGDGPAKADAAPEKTEFAVHLAAHGAKKIDVIKVVRNLTGLGLKEAKELVDGAPALVKDGLNKEDTAKYKAELEAAGATVEIK